MAQEELTRLISITFQVAVQWMSTLPRSRKAAARADRSSAAALCECRSTIAFAVVPFRGGGVEIGENHSGAN